MSPAANQNERSNTRIPAISAEYRLVRALEQGGTGPNGFVNNATTVEICP
jgi:hypothetical protein